jgi:hypothetical protein
MSISDSLGTLARATNLTKLDTQWERDPKDFPHNAVHAAKYCELRGVNADSVLFDAMPSNGTEMESLYDAQDIYDRQGVVQRQDMAVTNAYNAFYTCLAGALKRNPERLPRFLEMIHSFDFVDVDEWPWLCGLASDIYEAHPRDYMAAVNKLKGKSRTEALDCRQAPDAP